MHQTTKGRQALPVGEPECLLLKQFGYADRGWRGRPRSAPLALAAAAFAFDRVRPPRRRVAAPNKRLPNASSDHLGKLVGHGRRWPAMAGWKSLPCGYPGLDNR